MCELANTLDPAYSIPGRNAPYEVSGLLNMPKPTIATLSNYLYSKTDNVMKNDLLSGMSKVMVDV